MGMAELPDFDALWNYGKPDEAETSFKKVLADVGCEAPADYRVELQTQLARSIGLQRRFDEAQAVLDSLEHDLNGASGRARVRFLLERGRILNSSGRKPEALPLFIEAWNLGNEVGEDGLAVDAGHMVAIVEEPTAALQWNLSSLQLASTSSMPAARKWRKSLHNNIGWTFFDLGNFDQALYHFERCRECAIENDDAEAERIARWCIAKTHRVQGDVETALAMQRVVAEDVEKAGACDGYVSEEIGECLCALGRGDEAAPYFAKAYEVLSQDPWLADAEPERLQRLQALSTAQ